MLKDHIWTCPAGHRIGREYGDCGLCVYGDPDQKDFKIVCENCAKEWIVPRRKICQRFCSIQCSILWKRNNPLYKPCLILERPIKIQYNLPQPGD